MHLYNDTGRGQCGAVGFVVADLCIIIVSNSFRLVYHYIRFSSAQGFLKPKGLLPNSFQKQTNTKEVKLIRINWIGLHWLAREHYGIGHE